MWTALLLAACMSLMVLSSGFGNYSQRENPSLDVQSRRAGENALALRAVAADYLAANPSFTGVLPWSTLKANPAIVPPGMAAGGWDDRTKVIVVSGGAFAVCLNMSGQGFYALRSAAESLNYYSFPNGMMAVADTGNGIVLSTLTGSCGA